MNPGRYSGDLSVRSSSVAEALISYLEMYQSFENHTF